MKQSILQTRLLPEQLALYYLGQEGFLIKYDGHYLLIDAYLSDYVDRNCSSPQVCWRRRYPAPITGDQLGFVDYVFCSHAHYDHTDPDTLRAIAGVNAKARFIVPAPIVQTVAGYGVDPARIIAAEAGQTLELGGIRILPVPAAHEQLHTDALGRYDALGYRLTLGNTVLFHAGDCCVYDGLAEQLGRVDIAMLPVNGRDFYRLNRDHIVGNMDSREAVELAVALQARLLVPMHFDLYDVNGVPAALVADTVERSGTYQPFHMFQPGERYIYGG